MAQGHIRQLHRARQMAVRNRTGQCNQIHRFLLEYGIESPKGGRAVPRRLAEIVEDPAPGRTGEAVRRAP